MDANLLAIPPRQKLLIGVFSIFIMSKRVIILVVSILWILWYFLGQIVIVGINRCPHYSLSETPPFCALITSILGTPIMFVWIFPFNLIIAIIFIFGLAFLIDKDINENKNFSHLVSAILIFFLGGIGGIIYLGYTAFKKKNNKPIQNSNTNNDIDQDI